MMRGAKGRSEAATHTGNSHYKMLGLEVALDFVIMFAVMYTMANSLSEVYFNINNFYMTGMMVTPMVIVMIVMMRSMFPNKRLNTILITLSAAAFFGFFTLERSQGFVGDRQFVRSMIPHHSGALLMCERAQLSDPELKSLCGEILAGQRKEIEQMKGILRRLSQ